MHLEFGRLALFKDQAPVRRELSVDDQGREVQEAYRDSRLCHVVEVLGQDNLVDEELEFEEVFARFTSVASRLGSVQLGLNLGKFRCHLCCHICAFDLNLNIYF